MSRALRLPGQGRGKAIVLLEDAHELLTRDGLLLLKVVSYLMELEAVVSEGLEGRLVALLDECLDLCVDVACGTKIRNCWRRKRLTMRRWKPRLPPPRR